MTNGLPVRRPSLPAIVLAAGAAGAALGLLWPAAGLALEPVASIFLRLVESIIAPLVFATLTTGIAGRAISTLSGGPG